MARGRGVARDLLGSFDQLLFFKTLFILKFFKIPLTSNLYIHA